MMKTLRTEILLSAVIVPIPLITVFLLTLVTNSFFHWLILGVGLWLTGTISWPAFRKILYKKSFFADKVWVETLYFSLLFALITTYFLWIQKSNELIAPQPLPVPGINSPRM